MSQPRRPGFTLLEIMLATAIGVLLLFALYTAFNAQLRQLDAGRDAVEESVLGRAVLARIANDIGAHLAPVVLPPTSSSSSGTQGSSGSSSSSTSSTPATNPAIGPSTVQFNLGIQGDNNSLMLFVSRYPRELTGLPVGATPPIVSDLRRVTYWLAGGPSAPLGLARQELKIATADEALTGTPVGTGDETPFVFAEEVRSVQFRYFDGANWQDTWDGTVQGNSSGAVIGPPVAIEIKIGVAPPNTKVKANTGDPTDPSTLKYYRHVVAIPTANPNPNATSGMTPSTGQ